MRIRFLVMSFMLQPFWSIGQAIDTLPLFTVNGNQMETSVLESGRNIQLITRKQIDEMPVTSLNEVMQYAAGLDFRQRGPFGAQADVSLRGGTFDQTLILVNGIKVIDPQTGHHSMNLGIDLNAIKQIEVIKGPAASRYGLNAFSGVINIVTEPAQEASWDVSSTVAQDGKNLSARPFYGGYDVNTTAHLGTTQSRHLISANRVQSTGYRPNTDLNRNGLFYHGATETAFGKFEAMGNVVQNAFGASGFYAFPIDSSSEEEVTTYLAALRHTISFKGFNISSRLYSRKNFDTYTLFRDAPEVFQNRHRTDVEGAELHGSYAYTNGVLGVGLEYRREAINSSNLGKWNRDNGGFFIENRLYLLNQNLTLSTGAYVNVSSDYGTQILPSLEASYRLGKLWSIFGNAGQSFRVPTFTDLYYVGPTNVGNANLRPEKSTQVEGGVKWGRSDQFLQCSYFYQESTGLIDWVRSSVSDPWIPDNYELLNTHGVDATYTWQFQNNPQEGVGIKMARIGYSWLNMERFENDELLSRYALNNLNHQITANLTAFAGPHWSLSMNLRYLDRRAYKDYGLIDLRLQYSRERIGWWVDATNLLDTDYIEAANAQMPGRWLRTGFQISLR